MNDEMIDLTARVLIMLFRVQGRIEKRDVFERLQPSAGSIYIAHSGLLR